MSDAITVANAPFRFGVEWSSNSLEVIASDANALVKILETLKIPIIVAVIIFGLAWLVATTSVLFIADIFGMCMDSISEIASKFLA